MLTWLRLHVSFAVLNLRMCLSKLSQHVSGSRVVRDYILNEAHVSLHEPLPVEVCDSARHGHASEETTQRNGKKNERKREDNN